MKRLTRRNILGAASALAGGTLVATPALAASPTRAAAADPIIALIAETDRLGEEMSRFIDLADKIKFAMPEDVRRGPSVVLPPLDPNRLTPGQHRLIDELLSPESRARMFLPHPKPFESEEDLLRHVEGWRDIDHECSARLVAEWRADKARIDRILDDAGYTALYRQADAIQERVSALFEEIEARQPQTIAGAIALIELAELDTEPYIDNVVAGLRAIAAGGAA